MKKKKHRIAECGVRAERPEAHILNRKITNIKTYKQLGSFLHALSCSSINS